MRNRAFLKVVLLGLLTFALVPGLAGAASQGQDLTGMLSSSAAERATAVSGAIINISPSSHDFGRVTVGSSAVSFDFTVTNTGVTDLHISGVTQTNPGSGFSVSIPGTIGPGLFGLLSVAYTAVGSGPVSNTIGVLSDATNGTFSLVVTAIANNAPFFAPPLAASYSAVAFVPFQVSASASDPDGDVLTYSFSSAPALPLGFGPSGGPTFDTNTGTLNWTPNSSGAGSYMITFNVSDGPGGATTTSGPIPLTVTAPNLPPIANAGGPYSGIATFPVAMDGSASTDPDGVILSYVWDFDDGGPLGSGATPSHTYAAAGTYGVSLTVTDNGSPALSDVATTTAQIDAFVPARIIQGKPANGVIQTVGNRLQQFGLEISGRPVTDVDPSTIRLSTTFPNAGTATDAGTSATKSFKVGDLNGNNFGDLDFWFRASDIEPVLIHVPNGTLITIVISARTFSDNLLVQGTIDLVKKGPSSVTSAAAPNPFKPETSISYSVERSGVVSVRIFSVGGQLVRSLREEFATAGTHEVRWNGRDEAGRVVPSGIYFVSVRQGSDGSTTRVVLAR